MGKEHREELRRRRERMQHRTAEDAGERVRAVLERDHDAEVDPAPTERSEEIAIGALARDDDLAGREHDLGGQQIVCGHPELAHQPGDTPAERETPTSDRRTALASLSGRLLREMEGGEHSSTELTISVKVPCQECGGRGYVETVNEDAHVVGDTTQECLTCGGRGAIPDDMPLSQFRELLASDFGYPFR